MRRYMLASLIILGMVLALSLTPQPVYACSGGSFPLLQEMIETADVIVAGHFVELDDAQANGIFRVERYLMGDPGGEYLMLAINDVVFVRRKLHDLGPRDCLPIISDFEISQAMILSITRNPNGTFSLSQKDTYFNFPESTAAVTLRIGNDIHSQVTQEFTQDELEVAISELIRQESALPEVVHPYPLKSSILIRTDTDHQYIIPVDRTHPIPVTPEEAFDLRRDQYECSELGCTAYTPNGVYTLGVQGRWLGDGISSAPTSDWFALWKENRIEVYGLIHGNAYEMNSVYVSPKSYIFHPTWSPDGRYLAFSDIRGLWLWDVSLPESQPKRIIPAYRDRVPVARYFSPLGRYLAVTEGNRRFTLDLESEARFPDGLVSPDDRRLIAYDTTAKIISSFELYDLVYPWNVELVERRHPIQQVEWLSGYELFLSQCGPGFDPMSPPSVPFCWIEKVNLEIAYLAGGTRRYAEWYTANTDYSAAFDYDRQNGVMLRLIGPQKIAIDHEEMDLTGLIEGDIIEAIWLPSLFYHED